MKRMYGYIKLVIYSALLILFYLAVINSTPPGGMVGDVLRNNTDVGIDASPLFYSEVEHMGELEDGVGEMIKQIE